MNYKEINTTEEFRSLEYKQFFAIGAHTFVAVSNVLKDSEGSYYVKAQRTHIPMKEGCMGELRTEIVTIRDKDLTFWKERSHI